MKRCADCIHAADNDGRSVRCDYHGGRFDGNDWCEHGEDMEDDAPAETTEPETTETEEAPS